MVDIASGRNFTDGSEYQNSILYVFPIMKKDIKKYGYHPTVKTKIDVCTPQTYIPTNVKHHKFQIGTIIFYDVKVFIDKQICFILLNLDNELF
jgi:hypothetical protein